RPSGGGDPRPGGARGHPQSVLRARHQSPAAPPRASGGRVDRRSDDHMTAVATQEIPLVDLKAQYATIRDEVRAAIDEVLESMQLTIGPNVRAFDQEFAS